jgi:N6-L-threonylcarbamoyladenine synthase
MKINIPKIILAIETSCDESATAVIRGEGSHVEILSNVVSSQIEIHQKYGGVVPEVAAREHVYNILPVINEALLKAKLTHKDLDAVAVTQGPGLITSLHVGVETAKTLALVWNKPLIPVHHIEAHLYANFINNTQIVFPGLVLTVSGGHTALYLMKSHSGLELIGETIDDAAGEAFDKSAQLMHLGYPGGPIISAEAARWSGISNTADLPIALPRPMLNKPNFNFSFSGLKTSLLYTLQKDKNWKNRIPEYCFELQEAIIETLVKKTIKAAEKLKVKTILLAGGVSANARLREYLIQYSNSELPNVKVHIPDLKYTTDNAAMVGTCAYFKTKTSKINKKSATITADPNLELN